MPSFDMPPSTPNPTNDRPGWSLEERDEAFITSLMPIWEWLYRYYFRVQTSGWDNIPEGQVLLVGSHNGGLSAPDMHMMMYDWFRRFGVDRPVYGLMHAELSQSFLPGTKLAVKAGAIMAHPRMARAALQAGASVLVYPGGVKDLFRPHDQRDRICFNDNAAFIKLALRYETPIVPMISWGAHDTLIVLKDLYPLLQQLHQLGLPWPGGIDPIVFPLYLGLPWGFGLGPIPNIPFPVQVHTRVLPPIYFPRYGVEAARDRSYIQDCYQAAYKKIQSGLDQLKNEVLNP
jgi:1-acyl-sn-glycerol-3-phosphate acyltransferase